jgi:choice-of-anchor I-like protein/phytase-like protein
MNKLYALTLLFFAFCSPLFSQELNIDHLSTYHTGVFDGGAAEIVAYDKNGERIFFINGDNKSVDVLDVSNPELPNLVNQIDITPYGGGLNSVAIFGDLVAVAIENEIKQEPGAIVFFDTGGNFLNQVPAGALPDMVIFSKDGQKVLSANEGEPNDDYNVDPEGSVTIVDLSAGVSNAVATQVTFEAYNSRKASLMNRGIRIFGNDGMASVAQDIEPEYIAFSPDGTLAYVSCQENNALAIVDIEQATVIDILALGYKDHEKGSVELKQYFLNDIPWYDVYDLGTPVYDGAETIKLGGFSGLCYDPFTSTSNQLSFWAVPDRGPNEATVNAGLSQNLRPFKLPNYESRLVKLIYKVDQDKFYISANSIYLKREDGVTPISGKGNIPGNDEVPVTRTDDTYFTNADYTVNGVDYHALDYDPYGGDFEGVIRVVDYKTKDYTFWLCDEYRPAIYHFDRYGVLMNRYVAEGTSLLGDTPQPAGFYGDETLPEVYNKRRANRGFEAIAYDYDEKIIYAFIQSPLNNPSNIVQNNSDVIRILGIDPSNGQPVKEFVYLLERNKDAGIGLSRVDKIGDAVYAGKGKFYVLERDSSTPDDGETGKKFVFEINIQGATNILNTPLSTKMTSTDPDDKTLEMMSADDLYNAGIRTVFKNKVVNLPSLGYLAGDKAEGLAIIPGGDLVVLNDNDFGLAGAGISDNSSMGFIKFQHDYGFDASDKDDDISIASRPTLGMYQPDAIVSYEVNGKTYILTANEGDSRDYDGYSEEDRVKDLVLDPFSFSNADWLQEDENLGRLKTTYANGDIDMDGMNEYIYSYGARSFSIWDEFGNLVFDSGDDFE